MILCSRTRSRWKIPEKAICIQRIQASSREGNRRFDFNDAAIRRRDEVVGRGIAGKTEKLHDQSQRSIVEFNFIKKREKD